MRPVLLLQNNYFEKLHRLVMPCVEFCRETGADFIDRSLTDDFDPDTLGLDAWPGVLPYGSVGFTKRCLDSTIRQWVYYDRDLFAASNWVPIYGDLSLNGGGTAEPLARLRAMLAAGGRFHVRPDREDKAFVGAVHDLASWTAMEADRMSERRQPLPEDTACWVSPLTTINAEYRCWFVDGNLVSVSSCRRDSTQHIEKETDAGLLSEAQRIADLHLPMPTIVMDLARTDDGLKVIEFNPIHSSGWYACDTSAVLGAWSDSVMARASKPASSLGTARP